MPATTARLQSIAINLSNINLGYNAIGVRQILIWVRWMIVLTIVVALLGQSPTALERFVGALVARCK